VTPRFERFAAIDWSGAKGRKQRGIALAVCEEGTAAPQLVEPVDRAWSRGEVLEWIIGQANEPTLIGLDLSPTFPFVDRGTYFPGWDRSPGDARGLWALVESLSADDPHLAATSFVAHAEVRRHFRQLRDCGDLFPQGAGRFRRCEEGQREMGLSPYSCFNLVGAAQVGKSSLTGMRVLHALAGRIPVWPFDPVPARGALIVEIYTTIAARDAGIPKGSSKIRDGETLDRALRELGSDPHMPFARRYDDHSTDAILTAAWLRANARRPELWKPKDMKPNIASTEGWTFGVR